MGREISDRLRFKYFNRQIKGREILDIGSEEGAVHKLLVESNKDKKIYTLDVDNDPDFKIDLNNHNNLNKDLKKRFDTIIAGDIIEHLENPMGFLRFCFKHLKEGGRLILTTPNAIGIQYLRNPAWCVNRDTFDEHLHAFTMPMLNLLFHKTGLKVINEIYINAFWMNRNPMQLIPEVFPRLKTNLMIIGEK
ncbi:class I SAM-dependent methyltransferase [Candidatus Pacearchaeota archaeon]|nr:class I SAM-dependent methyltransferase [Candidatus Pacearchaeota archaeon]